jgi:CRP/FNR family transcriptional regulator
MGPVVFYGISRGDLEVILRDHPQVALNVTKVLAEQARHLGSLVEDLSFRHVIGRVARILLEQAGNGTGPRPRLTQQEMAAMAGTVREVVGRSLKALEEEGAIRLERHRIVITDREALKDMVEAYS